MKKYISLLFLLIFLQQLNAQDEEEPEKKKGFNKENLFTGGSISLSFFNSSFLIGVNPVLGYSLTKWADAGIAINFNYTSYRDYQVFDDKLRQTIYGVGVFARLYPVRFIFLQAQPEHNFITVKHIFPNGGPTDTYKTSGNSFFYVAILFDVSGNDTSPYTDAYGRKIPIIRAGIQIPLFSGGGNPNY